MLHKQPLVEANLYFKSRSYFLKLFLRNKKKDVRENTLNSKVSTILPDLILGIHKQEKFCCFLNQNSPPANLDEMEVNFINKRVWKKV